MTRWRLRWPRPPRPPEQLTDPRRLTDGVAPEDCICPPFPAPIDPRCPVHNMTIQEEP